MTTEHSLPVIEAAHILHWAAGGAHEVPNGLPLRRDLHRLFDLGYVTVRPDLRFQVSSELRDDYANGRVYYELAGRHIQLPADPAPTRTSSCWPGTSPPSTGATDGAMSGAIDVETFDDPLAAVPRVVGGADEALLGVAFIQHRGVNLLEHELRTVPRSRLVITTAFGSTTAQRLAAAQAPGLNVHVLNPSRGTFHSKLYVARHDDEIVGAIGSANLTSGLVTNIEAGAILRGHRSAPPMVRLWELVESWWEHVDAVDWSPERIVAAPEVLAPDLLAAIMAALCTDRVVRTIADGNENWIQDITPDGVWSKRRGRARRAGQRSSSRHG